MLAITPSGGHLEYYTGNNAERWNVKTAVDYISYLESLEVHPDLH